MIAAILAGLSAPEKPTERPDGLPRPSAEDVTGVHVTAWVIGTFDEGERLTAEVIDNRGSFISDASTGTTITGYPINPVGAIRPRVP